ncbi:hypothetical protein WI80_14610 [Burkholderia ubonensis]|uniref:Cap15 family cyclic dinucleotide receptor domain-containing protein n=1 Tax=Burkholderia ubonensis TaxID=101571 RepID=UPI00075C83BA|nr:hypothetical protein [Burkholderia ubonensis]KVD08038.1 hypothetical protein WI80_14610 [Burkholderia ubonensis]
MTEHEYSILDHDRGRVFQYIGTAITILATLYTASLGLLGNLVTHLYPGIWAFIPKTVDNGVAFAVLYFLFNRWFWRKWLCKKLFGLHDLEGNWTVNGTTLGPAEALPADGSPRQWTGTLTIKQKWTRIAVRLKTANSESFSRSAAVQDDDGGAVLMYSYSNDPTARARATENLQWHRGYCELKFCKDGRTATGFYFNNMGRVTHGEMTLVKAG